MFFHSFTVEWLDELWKSEWLVHSFHSAFLHFYFCFSSYFPQLTLLSFYSTVVYFGFPILLRKTKNTMNTKKCTVDKSFTLSQFNQSCHSGTVEKHHISLFLLVLFWFSFCSVPKLDFADFSFVLFTWRKP